MFTPNERVMSSLKDHVLTTDKEVIKRTTFDHVVFDKREICMLGGSLNVCELAGRTFLQVRSGEINDLFIGPNSIVEIIGGNKKLSIHNLWLRGGWLILQNGASVENIIGEFGSEIRMNGGSSIKNMYITDTKIRMKGGSKLEDVGIGDGSSLLPCKGCSIINYGKSLNSHVSQNHNVDFRNQLDVNGTAYAQLVQKIRNSFVVLSSQFTDKDYNSWRPWTAV